MTKRTKATSISPAVKVIVYARDEGLCIFCGRPGNPEAHVIPRSQGGLGIEENIITVCRPCHDAMDNGKYRREFVEAAKDYLAKHYGTIDKDKLIYRKGNA